ncbi:ubiquitin carboxyl-terminal hydrolase 31 isoform X3 [Vanacampus margaritifer]
MSCKATTKDKKTSFGKKLFRRGSVRSVGSFMSRILRTLTALSHFGSEVQTDDDKDDGGFSAFQSGLKEAPLEDGDLGLLLSGDRIPGVAGLKNHGNTCFMNAILQCLSNTELFAEYLVLEHSRQSQANEEDKPKTNEVHLQKKGPLAKGEVTEQLSGLVRALWTFEYTPQHSRDFKNAVSKNATQFKGNAQHDAQEFLLWLLDRVHEDLNTVKPIGRPTMRPPIDEDDRTTEGPSPPISAGSFVQELFQAQYRPLYVTVVYQGKYSHCLRIGVAVPLNSTVYRLRDAVSRETNMPMDQFIMTEMYYDGFHRSFCDDDDDLDIIQESDSIFAFETPETFKQENLRTKRGSLLANLNHNNLKYSVENGCTSSFMQGVLTPVTSPNKNLAPEKIILLVCNRACTGHQAKRFGLPFVLYMERTATWDTLQKEILEKMRHLLRPGVYIQVGNIYIFCYRLSKLLELLWNNLHTQVGPFSLRVVGVVGITYLLPQDERPLCHPTVDRAYKSCGQGGPPHVKIVVEWDKETKDYLFGHTEEEYIPDAESVYLLREQHHQPQACTLAQCFQLYTKEEQLAPDDAWRCPHCKQLQQGRIKLSLWTLPDVLILHLKRFRQEGDRRVKMQNMVRFPLMGMDMAPHVVKRSQSSWSLPSHWSPWRRPYGLGRNPDDFLYDLYAVCNHHGSMHGGHYTAYCKNSVDGQWYCFDDSEVAPVADDDVCQQTAYILFYQRRTAIPSWSANSSVAGSTSSSLCDHWINRLPGSRAASLASGASSRRTSLASLAESVEFTGERSEDDGGFSVRPFVRSIQRQSVTTRSSIASPLAFSDNTVKPSWSLSAKLQMRSNSPSRFSLDSRCSPPLEKIGEACDDRVSTSCFGSYSRHERYFGGKTPLSAMESNYSEQENNKRFLDMMYCRAPTPVEKITENNNQITAVDQNIQNAPTKDQKHKSSTGGFVSKAESAAATKTTKAEEPGKTSKKRLCSTHKPSPSETPASTPVKGKKATATKDKSEKKSISTPSRTPSKTKESLPPSASTPQHRLCVRSTSQSSALPSPTTKKNPGVHEKNPENGRKRQVERSYSRDSVVNAQRGSVTTRSSAPKAADSGRLERRSVRSSSSSSSVTSLRSPSVSTRDLQRGSKSEEKGLSFFKSALRQRESRRSADLGKSTLLFKRASERTCKQNGQVKEGGVEHAKATDAAAAFPPPADATKSEPLKPAGSLGRSLLHVGKSKSSTADVSLKSPANGKKPIERKTSSRKLSLGTQSPARATQRPQ